MKFVERSPRQSYLLAKGGQLPFVWLKAFARGGMNTRPRAPGTNALWYGSSLMQCHSLMAKGRR